MKMTKRALLTVAAVLTATAAAPLALAAEPAARAPAPGLEQDRQSILAMAGNYKVRFDFRETVPFVADYKPIEPKVSGGYEAVRVIEDTGRVIRLQHLLVVETDGGQPMVIKHWRQDWTYEPASVLVYTGKSRWKTRAVPAAERKGAWSQTVWQTDDSPRYGGLGHWVYDDGVARWMSDTTERPLARRDATRKPVYDRYVGTNRHALTPAGWVHEQDNAKIGARDGRSVTFVHEVVLNTYTRDAAFDSGPADRYWAATAPYWAAVRKAWDEVEAMHGGVSLEEEADAGSITGPTLMGLADDIARGVKKTDAAIAEAKAVIAEETGK